MKKNQHRWLRYRIIRMYQMTYETPSSSLRHLTPRLQLCFRLGFHIPKKQTQIYLFFCYIQNKSYHAFYHHLIYLRSPPGIRVTMTLTTDFSAQTLVVKQSVCFRCIFIWTSKERTKERPESYVVISMYSLHECMYMCVFLGCHYDLLYSVNKFGLLRDRYKNTYVCCYIQVDNDNSYVVIAVRMCGDCCIQVQKNTILVIRCVNTCVCIRHTLL
jgi:hypothetical protein